MSAVIGFLSGRLQRFMADAAGKGGNLVDDAALGFSRTASCGLRCMV